MALNRIYVTSEEMARSLYRRSKERQFTTEDVMRLHWDRQGDKALAWARERIKRFLKAGVIVSTPAKGERDKRRVFYSFTEDQLRKWNLHK